MPTPTPTPPPARRAEALLDVRPYHRMTLTEQLQAAWDSVPDLMEAEIVFRPFRGWYADPDEQRYFLDEGEPLGANWREAVETIKWLAR